ncbi:hypothetical protein Q4R40_14500 [Morganella morganii]|nr:hypothetical protein [Morganella morganii]
MNVKINKEIKISLSKINNLSLNNTNSMSFEKITVKNTIFSGECFLYKDNTHIANIVFELVEK